MAAAAIAAAGAFRLNWAGIGAFISRTRRFTWEIFTQIIATVN
jgi:hypothetical protein